MSIDAKAAVVFPSFLSSSVLCA